MSKNKPTILIIATLDTQLPEILFLRAMIHASSNGACGTRILDVSRGMKDTAQYLGLPGSELLLPLLDTSDESHKLGQRGNVDRAVAKCIPEVQTLVQQSKIHGLIAAASGSGAALATAIMSKACPIGFPKLMVSTMASGDIRSFVQGTDITTMYSVVEIAGLNSILKDMLSNAAGAIVGMASAFVLQRNRELVSHNPASKRIAITMSEFTTPCVDMIRNTLTSTPHDVSGHEIYVFHATGYDDWNLQRLIEEGRIDAVIDLTATNIVSELIWGPATASPDRLSAAANKGIPLVLSVGACDMTTFGSKDTAPEKFADRLLYVHSPSVTLMRTTEDENRRTGEVIVSKLKTALDPSNVRVLLPRGGVSNIGKEGQAFHDSNADTVLFGTIKSGLDDSDIEVHEHPDDINADYFARVACEHILELMGVSPRNYRLANARRRQWSFSHGATVDAIRKASLIEIPDAN